MVTDRIREFVERDWEAVREIKDRYWGDRIQDLGAREGFRIADELRRQVLALDPQWPGRERRREDLEAHIRLAGAFRRAAATGRG